MLSKTSLVFAFFLAALLSGLVVIYGGKVPVGVKEGFMQKQTGAPLSGGGMGPYDEVSMEGASGWLSSEPAPLTGGMPGQSQDGKLMFLADNRVSSECCPGPFSGDVGCVCLTETDKKLMGGRGGNKA